MDLRVSGSRSVLRANGNGDCDSGDGDDDGGSDDGWLQWWMTWGHRFFNNVDDADDDKDVDI